MDILNALLKDARFWAALWLVVQTVLFYFVPTFPEQLWAALNGFFAVVLAIITGTTASNTAREARATRAAAAKK